MVQDNSSFLDKLNKISQGTSSLNNASGWKLPQIKPTTPTVPVGSTQGSLTPLSVLGKILKPLTVLDTPRRAIISGVREIADVLDSNPDTNASLGDWWKQTKDTSYGFGTAFPMSGWGGKIVGFIGDVALDPLTYATLGGTVAAKSVVRGAVNEAGEALTTRAALGGLKYVGGRQGREALANLARQRLKKFQTEGMKFADNEIETLVKNIAARGKQGLPGFLADDIGIKGPGIYYFGSRVKVPGSGIIGKFVERNLTKTRLGIVSPKYKLNPGQYLHNIKTPEGVGNIADLGPDQIRKWRVGLANGTLTPKEADFAIVGLHGTEAQRLAAAKATENATQMAWPVMQDRNVTIHKNILHKVLENQPYEVVDESMRPSIELAAQSVRNLFDTFYDDLDNTFRIIDPNYPLRKKGDINAINGTYVPLMESDDAIKARIRVGEEQFDELIGKQPLSDSQRTASSFRGRSTQPGDNFFGHILKEEDINHTTLNQMARNSVDPLKPSLTYDLFETDIQAILGKYVRHYSQQKGVAGLMEDVLSNGPEYMKRWDQMLPIDAEHAAMYADKLPKDLNVIHVNTSKMSNAILTPSMEGVNISNVINDVVEQNDKINKSWQIFGEQLENNGPDSPFGKITARRNDLNDQLKVIAANPESPDNVELLQKFALEHQQLVDEQRKIVQNVWRQTEPQVTAVSIRRPDIQYTPNQKSHLQIIQQTQNGNDAYLPNLNNTLDGAYSKLDEVSKKELDDIAQGPQIPKEYGAVYNRPPQDVDKRIANIVKTEEEQFAKELKLKKERLSTIPKLIDKARDKIAKAKETSELIPSYVFNVTKKEYVKEGENFVPINPVKRQLRTVEASHAVQDVLIHQSAYAEINLEIAAGRTLSDNQIADIFKKHTEYFVRKNETDKFELRILNKLFSSMEENNYLTQYPPYKNMSNKQKLEFVMENISFPKTVNGDEIIDTEYVENALVKHYLTLSKPSNENKKLTQELLNLNDKRTKDLEHIVAFREPEKKSSWLAQADKTEETLAQNPAVVQHAKNVKTGPTESVLKKRVKFFQKYKTENGSVLENSFNDYLKQIKTKAQEYRSRVSNQGPIRAKLLEKEEAFNTFLTNHNSGIQNFQNSVVSFNSRKSLETAFYKSFPQYKENGVGERFLQAFFNENESYLTFLNQIPFNNPDAIMTYADIEIAIHVLEKNSKFSTKQTQKFRELLSGVQGLSENKVKYMDFKSMMDETLKIKMLTNIDKASEASKLSLLEQVNQQRQYMLRIQSEATKLEQEYLTLTPENFFRQPKGSLVVDKATNLGEVPQRTLVPNIEDVVDPKAKPHWTEAKITSMEENEFYPQAKAVEKRANLLLHLSNINGESVDWTLANTVSPLLHNGRPMSVSEGKWASLINTKDLTYMPDDEINSVLMWLREPGTMSVIAPEELAKNGGYIADEKRVNLFVDYIYRNQTHAIASETRVASRKNFITTAWNKSDSNKFLSTIDENKRILELYHSKQNKANPVSVIHSVLSESEFTSNMRKAELVQANDWDESFGKQLDNEMKALIEKRNETVELLSSTDQFEPFTELSRPRLKDDKPIFGGSRKGSKINRVQGMQIEETSLTPNNSDYLYYLRVVKVPKEILDGPLENLNNYIATLDTSSVSGLNKMAASIDDVLKTPLESKSVEQIKKEIEILRTIRREKIDTPYTTTNKIIKLIKERESILSVIEPSSYKPRIAPTGEEIKLANKKSAEITSSWKSIRNRARTTKQQKDIDRWYTDKMMQWTTLDIREKQKVVAYFKNYADNPDFEAAYFEAKRFVKPDIEYIEEANMTPTSEVSSVANPSSDYYERPLDVPSTDENIYDSFGDTATESEILSRATSEDMRQLPATPENMARYEPNPNYDPNLSYMENLKGTGNEVAPPNPTNLPSAKPYVRPLEEILKAEKQASVNKSIEGLRSIETRAAATDVWQQTMAQTRETLSASLRTPIIGVGNQDKVLTEKIQVALNLLQDVEKRGSMTPVESVLIENGLHEANFITNTAGLSETEIEKRLMDGLSGVSSEPAGFRVIDKQTGEIIPQKYKLLDNQMPVYEDLPTTAAVSGPLPNIGEATRVALTDGWSQLGQKYPSLVVSQEFKDVWGNAQYFSNPKFVSELTHYIGGFTKFHKAYATLTPGFHVRNAIGNAFQYVLAGGKMENIKVATDVHFKWIEAYKKGIPWETFLKTEVLPEHRAAAMIGRDAMLGSGGGIYGDIFHQVVKGSKLYDNKLTRFSQKWGQQSDNFSRFLLGFDGAKQGMNREFATARVRKFYFDYEDLSKMDKVAKQFVPFWLWTSRNLPLQIENMYLNPKPYLIYNSFVRNIRDKEAEQRGPLPQWLTEVGAFRIPGVGAYAAPDLNFTRVQQQLEQFQNPKKLGTNLTPLLRIPIEQAMGQNLFNDKEIATPEDRLTNALQGLVVPVATGDRLLNSYGDAKINAWLSVFGSPIKKIKEP
jgi:hypothetical protein